MFSNLFSLPLLVPRAQRDRTADWASRPLDEAPLRFLVRLASLL